MRNPAPVVHPFIEKVKRAPVVDSFIEEVKSGAPIVHSFIEKMKSREPMKEWTMRAAFLS